MQVWLGIKSTAGILNIEAWHKHIMPCSNGQTQEVTCLEVEPYTKDATITAVCMVQTGEAILDNMCAIFVI